ncbi:hypothetical protein GE061_019651 [Apolygus lucorum]|uniref:IGFBP N-terminal domain-containing protein n=1 Tax=Apolygus lucorum TaxID=248454 RepID=A0A8S9XB07_APOLU|nr:hypothetical protein GE061_019651 [Apolygus lucorum]
MPKMIVFGLVALAAIQVSKACVDNEHIISPMGPQQQPNCPQQLAPPPCPSSCAPEAPWNYGFQCDQQPCVQPPSCPCNPCPCNPCPCNLCAAEPCIKSVTRVANQCDCQPGPVLQSALQCPLFPEPLVPVVENHVGHHIMKTIKHVPVVRKYCRPELVIRTRHIPVVKHRKRVFIEPYTAQIPITDKLIRQVIHEITHRLPVVHKCIKPYTYQTVRHVPLSCAQSMSGVSNPPCCQIPGQQNFMNTPFPCNGPCPCVCGENSQ